MIRRIWRRFAHVAALAALALAVWRFAAQTAGAACRTGEDRRAPAPRENLMKACGDEWRGVREAETANGVTWPQYLARCRAQAAERAGERAGRQRASRPLPAPSASPPAAPARRAERAAQPAPKPQAESQAPRTSAPVFPQEVAARHASERPALGRQRTCADQFKANKTTEANGGLRWIEQGGGYWSRCNAHLKQTRA